MHPMVLLLVVLLAVSIAAPAWMFLRRQGQSQAREQRLRAAQEAVVGELLLQGTVQARPGERVRIASAGQEVVAYASWVAERLEPTDVPLFQTLDLEIRAAPFDLVTAEGSFAVVGRPAGISDLVEVGYPGPRTVIVAAGDVVSILGVVTEEADHRGFFGDYILVTASPEAWLAAVGEGPFPSLPEGW